MFSGSKLVSEAATNVSQEIKGLFTNIEDCRTRLCAAHVPIKDGSECCECCWHRSLALHKYCISAESNHIHTSPLQGAAQFQELIIKREREIRAWPFWLNSEPFWRVIPVLELPVGSLGLWVVLDDFPISHSVQCCSFPLLPQVQFQENFIMHMESVHQLLTSMVW